MKLTDQTKPEDFQNPGPSDHSHIIGWGIDANPKNDPTYPIKNRTDEEQKGYVWERPELQPVDTEILHSVERKNTPAVFGTTVPPKGWSGMLRRFAFKYSESSYGRWLPLVLADRIGVVEGIADDLSEGHIPDLWKEYGLEAEWKHNRTSFILKASLSALAVSALIAYALSDKEEK